MRFTIRGRRIVATLAASVCSLGLLASASQASTVQLDAPASNVLVSPLASSSDLPPGCASHWKDPNVRVRTARQDSYLHEMSNNCVPYGAIDGTVRSGSTFNLYFADPYEDTWCYGYSVNLRKLGYVWCPDVAP